MDQKDDNGNDNEDETVWMNSLLLMHLLSAHTLISRKARLLLSTPPRLFAATLCPLLPEEQCMNAKFILIQHEMHCLGNKE